MDMQRYQQNGIICVTFRMNERQEGIMGVPGKERIASAWVGPSFRCLDARQQILTERKRNELGSCEAKETAQLPKQVPTKRIARQYQRTELRSQTPGSRQACFWHLFLDWTGYRSWTSLKRKAEVALTFCLVHALIFEAWGVPIIR